MLNMNELIRNGFKIVDGRLCDRYGSSICGNIRVREFGLGTPCIEYHFDDYDLHEYSIVKAVHYDEWYLKKNGYQEVCRLHHLGGNNWETM